MLARILLALGLGAALAGCTGGVGDSPSKVVDAFMAASKAKDTEKVKRYLTKESIDTYEKGEALEEEKDEKEPRGTWKVLKEEIKGDAAEVTLQVENLGEGPKTAEMIVVCVRQGGRWLIDLDKTMQGSVRKGFQMMLEEAAKEEAGKEKAGGAPAAKGPSDQQIRKGIEVLRTIEKVGGKVAPPATKPAAEETEPEGGAEEALKGMPSDEEVKAAAKAMEAIGEMLKKAMEEAAKKGKAVPPAPGPKEEPEEE